MPCPIDGMEYVIIGDQSVCPKCGHVAGYKQIDIVQLLKENEQLKIDRDFYKKMWLDSANTGD